MIWGPAAVGYRGAVVRAAPTAPGWGVTRHPRMDAAERRELLYRNHREISGLENLRRSGAPEVPNNHRTVHYSFEVDGKAHSGAQEGGVSQDVPGFSSNCNGNVVFYLPDDPSVSCIGDPAPMFNNEVISIPLPMLTFPPFALLGWRWRSPRFRRWLNAEKHSAPENPSTST